MARMLAGWAVFRIATWRALDTPGVVLTSIILGAFVGFLIDTGWVHTDSVPAITWVALVCLATILASVSRGHTFPAASRGQLNVEDVHG